MMLPAARDELSWVVRSLDLRGGPGGIAASAVPAERPFDAIRRLLVARGFSVAERKVDARSAGTLPERAIVEIDGARLALVDSGPGRRLALRGEQGVLPADGALDELLTGRALVYYPAGQPSVIRSLLRCIAGDPGLAAAARSWLTMTLASRLCLLAAPLAAREYFGRALPDGERSTVLALAGFVVLAGILAAAALAVRGRSVRYLEAHLGERFGRDLFAAALRRPFAELVAAGPAAAWDEFTSMDAFVRTLVALVVAVVDGLFGAAFLLALATFAPRTAGIAALGSLLALGAVVRAARRQMPARRRWLEARQERQALLLESLEAVEVVRAEGLESHVLRKLGHKLHEERAAELAIGGQRAGIEAIGSGLERGLFLLVFATLGWEVLVGHVRIAEALLALQLIVAFEVAFHAVVGAPERIGALAALRSWLDGATRRLAESAAPSAEPRTAGAIPADRSEAENAILVDDVWFRPAASAPWTFSGLGLRVKRGAHLRLRWPSGAGKTTLLRLLAGLEKPARGRVVVDGESAATARDRVFYVPQGAPLLSTTLIDNLVVLSGGASREAIFDAAEITGFRDVVARWPMQWGTVLTGGGRTISSGQRQLLLVTAAVASRAPIVLLDESFAHIDATLRRRLLDADPFRGRTVLSVEHTT